MIYRKEVTVSTNLDARAGKPGDVFTAEFQTAGRGRLDHKWQSAKSENLMFSIVLDVGGQPPAEIATLPLVVGLAVARQMKVRGEGEQWNASSSQSTNRRIDESKNFQPSLKWPNDVLVNGRKLCGILCERAGENVIAGVGVNVNQTKFDPEIAERATSLALLVGHEVDREEVLQSLIASINSYHARWMAGGFAALLPEFEKFDCLKGREISVLATDDDAEPITGICGGIQSDGSLLVGATRVYAGEAHVMEGLKFKVWVSSTNYPLSTINCADFI